MYHETSWNKTLNEKKDYPSGWWLDIIFYASELNGMDHRKSLPLSICTTQSSPSVSPYFNKLETSELKVLWFNELCIFIKEWKIKYSEPFLWFVLRFVRSGHVHLWVKLLQCWIRKCGCLSNSMYWCFFVVCNCLTAKITRG